MAGYAQNGGEQNVQDIAMEMALLSDGGWGRNMTDSVNHEHHSIT